MTLILGRNKRLGHGAARRAILVVRICLSATCFLWVLPIVGDLTNSFRTREAQQQAGWWNAIANPLDFTQWTLDNYYATFFTTSEDGVNMGRAFVNSILVTVPGTVIPVLLAAFAAYSFTFMQWRGRDALFMVFIALVTVPNQIALVPLLRLYNELGINGTFLAIWLVHMGFGMPLAVFIMRNHMTTLPMTLVDAARVDGASHFTMFWRLVLPLSWPAFVTFAVVQFIWIWNDLLLALLFLGRGDNGPATLALQGLLGQDIKATELIPAAAIVAIAVPVILVLPLRGYFTRGLSQSIATTEKRF